MFYIDQKPNPSGAYPNLKCQPFHGCYELDDEQAEIYIQYNGFIRILSTNPVVIEPDVEAWEAWKANHPEPEPEPDPEATDTEVLNALLGVSV